VSTIGMCIGMADPRQRADKCPSASFINQVQVGPRHAPLFGSFFLAAVAEAEKAGLEIVFGTFEELVAINRQQAANWHPLTPVFDPQFAPLPDAKAFCIFGLTQAGEIVAAHAARLFDWTDSNFTQEAINLRLFYADPPSMKLPGEACIVTAQSGNSLTGKVAYSGAAWVRPDYRGRSLSSIFPRIGKVYAYTRWHPDIVVGLMSEQNWKRGLASKAGYTTVDWAVETHNSRVGDWRFALLTMREACVVDYATQFLGNHVQEVDRGIFDGGAEQQVAPGRIAKRQQ
jgi:hypothetical protein